MLIKLTRRKLPCLFMVFYASSRGKTVLYSSLATTLKRNTNSGNLMDRAWYANFAGGVAVIIAIDDSSVYMAQENYSDMQFFLALPITREANSYTIGDLSKLSNRIIRSWIHFTSNGGLAT